MTDRDPALTRIRRKLDGDPHSALADTQSLCRREPGPAALRLLAECYRRLAFPDHAEKAELMAVQASVGDPSLRRAEAALQSSRTAEALAISREYLKRAPDDLLGLIINAEALFKMRLFAQAEQAAVEVLKRAPSYTRACLLVARTLMMQCRLREGIEFLQGQLQRRPGNQDLAEMLGQLLLDRFDFAAAAELYERLETASGRPHINHAFALRLAGRTADSERTFRGILAADPANGEAWWGLVTLLGGAVAEDDRAAIESVLERASNQEDSTAYLHIALATILNRSGEHSEAFRNFAEGNAIRERASNYDPDVLTREVDRSIEALSADLLQIHAPTEPGDATPIFIVGMPRSGSTLLERVLGSHSKIEAAGELQVLPRLVDQVSAEMGMAADSQALTASLSAQQARRLGELYLRRAQEFRRTDKGYFTDKLHVNWRHIALIEHILPNAAVIDVRRDPLDCCWSNFKLFARGYPASNDLAHLGRFYSDYVRLMDHVTALAPERILRVTYEDVVDDLEREARRILAFLGLEFEPACLNFHRLEGAVGTASAEQVRRPINREGIGASRPYLPWLGPLVDALGANRGEQ